MAITRQLAAFCADLTLDGLSDDIIERTRLLILDLVGSIVRGRNDAASSASLFAMVDAMGWGQGNSHVFGDPKLYSPSGAAFLNAALGHSLDFDDTHAAGTLHPGAPVIPAAIAAGEMVNASGADVLAAIVAGYEVTCRIAVALPAGDHYARGFHPTATCGVFGAAAAAGRVFGLSGPQIEAALGTALSQSAGSLQFLTDGAWTKPFQVGWASMAGLAAALLARAGFKGPHEAIEGRHGFLQGYASSPRPERVIEDLGQVWELMNTGVKPYPSCRYGHAGIDAVLALRAKHDLQPDEVDSITYGISKAGLLLVGEPIDVKQNPTNIVGAQFSAPFVLASALVTGEMAWSSYERLEDPAIRTMLSRVHCVLDDDIEAEFPTNMSGKIIIRARAQEYSRTVIVPLGEPSNFLGQTYLTQKYLDLASPSLGSSAQKLADSILNLDLITNIRAVTSIARMAS